MAKDKIPSYADLIQPVLTALHDLSGIAGTFMIDEAVIENLKLPQEVAERRHVEQDDHRHSRSEISYRLAWARTYLKHYGLIENPQQGLWQLTPRGRQVKTVHAKEVFRCIRQQRKGVKRA